MLFIGVGAGDLGVWSMGLASLTLPRLHQMHFKRSKKRTTGFSPVGSLP